MRTINHLSRVCRDMYCTWYMRWFHLIKWTNRCLKRPPIVLILKLEQRNNYWQEYECNACSKQISSSLCNSDSVRCDNLFGLNRLYQELLENENLLYILWWADRKFGRIFERFPFVYLRTFSFRILYVISASDKYNLPSPLVIGRNSTCVNMNSL